MSEGNKIKGRAEQLAGAAKKKFGEMIGNRKVEAEGAATEAKGATRANAERAKDYVKGTADSAAGRVKSAVGRTAGDDELRARGEAQSLKGDAERKLNK